MTQLAHVSAARVPAAEAKLPQLGKTGTYRRILEEALMLFAQTGYHGTSVRDIASAVGIQIAALYVHFPSKGHVLAELCRIGHEEHQRALRTALLDAGSSPADQLAALVRAHVRLHAEYAMLATVANYELHALPDELAGATMALRRQSEALLIEVCERGEAQKKFTTPDVVITAAAIGAMGMRVAQWYRADLGKTIDEIANVHAELALRMFGAR
ncbi:MAG TPA: TetR/AcrR family transcriptional regulator [Kofleriaceae bacterium]|nr:TetR/AcrR family transcriptional regulator [Kofleriaceae bacterium]